MNDSPTSPATEKGFEEFLYSEAVAISLFAGVSYGATFLYELAYLRSFGVPPQLVETSFDAVFVVGTMFLGVFFALFPIVNLLALWWPENSAYRTKALRSGIILLFASVPGLAFGFNIGDWPWIVAAILYVLVFEIWHPLLAFRSYARIADRLQADEDFEDQVRGRTLFGRLQLAFTPQLSVVFVLSIATLALAYQLGAAEATRSKVHYFLKDNTEWLVIRIRSDKFIAVKFDETSLTVKPELRCGTIENDGPVFVRREIGRLKFEKLNRPPT